MDKLIEEIQAIIDDFRKDEGVNIDKKRIKKWIVQFDKNDHIFLLTELKNIFEKRYISKSNLNNFLKKLIEKLTTDYKYKNPKELLDNSIFLNLQDENKSQTIILKLLTELLKKEYNYDIKDCGIKTKSNCIYIDDILCTGNTLFQNIKEWALTKNGNTNNYGVLKGKKINLIFCYIFLHKKNFHKVISRMDRQIGSGFNSDTNTYRRIEVENGFEANSKLDFLFPVEFPDDKLITDYQKKVTKEVDNYCKSKNFNSPQPEFYRNPKYPVKEEFFSNSTNRKKFEKILLKKGIEILNSASTNIPNMRALGYDLPSHKNFGFGALSFTYRNIPNNAPLVFWYDGGGFFPLFIKNPTSQKQTAIDD